MYNHFYRYYSILYAKSMTTMGMCSHLATCSWPARLLRLFLKYVKDIDKALRLRVYQNSFLALCPIIWGRYSGKILWRFGTLPLSGYRPMEEQRQRYGPPLYKLTSFVVLLRVFLVVWWSSFDSTDMYNSLTLFLSLCRSKLLFSCLHPLSTSNRTLPFVYKRIIIFS